MLHTDTPHESPAANVHLGTAGWNVRQEYAHRCTARGISPSCIFDNTALGAATSDALTVKPNLLDNRRVTR